MSDRPLYWSDQLAFGVEQKFSDRGEFVVASGISPSGLVHAGNFREIITTDLVAKSLKNRGKDVRFIYSWDDYDRFRKVPEKVPDDYEKYIGLPLTSVPDPEGCHGSYAEHFEKKLEEELEGLKIDAEFIRQTEKFQNCDYTELIKKSMNQREKIKEILDKYRREPLEENWWPLRVYCPECNKDFTEIIDYDGETTITFTCEECNSENSLDFSETDSVKPPWRIDWPMRWFYEGVDFEPAGKEHSASGGSRDTANEIVREVYGMEPPVHQMYEFVTKDGAKISSSSGEDAFTISELKNIYSTEMIRFLFTNTKPSKSFEIPFESEEVFQRYDNFDKIEKAHFNPEEVENDRKRKHWKRVYELAVVDIPEEKPVRVPFQHCSFIAQTVPEERWGTKGIESLKRTGHVPEEMSSEQREMILERLEKARNWARDYAPEEYRFEINEEVNDEILNSLKEEQREAVSIVRDKLEEKKYEDQEELDGDLFDCRDESELETSEFFSTIYRVLLSRDEGPRLSRLIMSIGQDKAVEIMKGVE